MIPFTCSQQFGRSQHRHSKRCTWMLVLQAFSVFVATFNIFGAVSAKYLDDANAAANGNAGVNSQHLRAVAGGFGHGHQQAHRRSQRDLMGINSNNNFSAHEQCEVVKEYFGTIDIQLSGNYEEKGAICGGNCCSNATEAILRQKAAIDFERLLHFNTKSLRGILKSTASLFRDHVLELTGQSENKTLIVFSQVYRHMVPLSTRLIRQLYSEIRSNLKNSNNDISNNTNNFNTNNNNRNSLENAIQQFFVNLFPVAYHQAVNLNKENYGELHEDYITCLKHTFDDLQPFGTIPKEIKHNLIQSVQMAQIFMNSLQQSADVLSETDELYSMYMTDTCQKQLLKMSYCPSCNGLKKGQVKACYSYCMNVMRGCSVQYVGILDSPWSNVVDAIDNLVATHIRSDNGIITTIKQLDGKLSEAIMRAMQNGPDLEKKLKKTCGTPKLLITYSSEKEVRPPSYPSAKWATPPDAEILRFLSTIEKSKEFYSNIVNNVCEDDDIQHNDHQCWTGDRIADYTQLVMTTGVTAQRYNPEVPLELNSQSTKLNELVDKLIKIRKNISSAVPSTARSYSDIQSDMARHDEEGSGRISDDIDDEEYGNIHGSGDSSGDGPLGPTSSPYDPMRPAIIDTNDIEVRSRAAGTPTLSCPSTIIITLVTIFLTSSRFLARPH